MAISKIILNNVTQMDIRDTTATASEVLEGYTAYGADGVKIFGEAIGGSGGAISDVVETLPGGGVHHIITGTGGYDINSGDLFSLFDQYAFENGMVKQDLSFAEDQTDYVTVNHNLGRVPVEALLYPKTPQVNSSGYQIGWTINAFGQDNAKNRTYWYSSNFSSNDSALLYGNTNSLLSLLVSIKRTDYNFSKNPTSTTVDIRGGTNSSNRLLAGEYVLALK